jgi:heme exporter protein D
MYHGQCGIIPHLASEFLQIACRTAVVALEIFHSFPREKPSLTQERRERERERRKRGERERVGLRVPL